MSELQAEGDSFALIDQQEVGSERYSIFSLDDEEYGVGILRVYEIIGWEKVAYIPNSPHYLCGVLNSRGMMIPVVDLQLRFGIPALAYTSTKVVVLLKVEGFKQRTVGIVVDVVSDAHSVLLTDIQPAPDFDRVINTDFISGLVTIGNTMTILINIDSLLSVEALG